MSAFESVKWFLLIMGIYFICCGFLSYLAYIFYDIGLNIYERYKNGRNNK